MKWILVALIIVSCTSNKVATKTSIKLLDEFRVDEYRGYVVTSVDTKGRWSNVSLYSFERKRHCLVKIPSWLSSYYNQGDTVK